MHPIQDECLLEFLLPKVRAAVLARLILDAHDWYAHELARATGLNHAAVRKELLGLTACGIALASRRGNRVYYTANSTSPVYGELKMLLIKTAGVADVLRAALKPLAGRIAFAYIYGSFAAGKPRADSDVDVMVVGDAPFADVVGALDKAEKKLGREVNPSLFPLSEYKEKLAKGAGFIHRVHTESKIMLIGEVV
jgi:uncharacterized protein